jgi:cysteine desulfurase
VVLQLTYLDHAATTPMRDDAVEAMLPYLQQGFANPSGSHRFARTARTAIDEARDQVAEILGCGPGDVVFTSGGTESDNTAVRGVVSLRGGRPVCSAAEHHAVLEPVEAAAGIVVPTDSAGAIDIEALREALVQNHDVSLVSVMAVNNEVGTVTDLAAVAAVVREFAPTAVLHTDAVQAPRWIDLRSVTPLVDMLSLSAHKFGGPKGVGLLVASAGARFEPLLRGGGQERERRSGTQNVAGIVALAVALAGTDRERAAEVVRLGALRDRLIDRIVGTLDGVHESVPRLRSVPGVAHLCFDGIENEALLYLLDEADVCASAASACAAGAMEPSHVLAAMGVERRRAMGALRLSLGRTTTDADVDRGIDAVVDAVRRLRR